jgi:NAD(P)H-binding
LPPLNIISNIIQAIEAVDAVITVLASNSKPVFEMNQDTRQIIAAMKELDIQRLAASAGAGVHCPNDRPLLWDCMIYLMLKISSRRFTKNRNNQKVAMVPGILKNIGTRSKIHQLSSLAGTSANGYPTLIMKSFFR